MVLFCRKDFVRFALKVLQCKYEENVKSVETSYKIYPDINIDSFPLERYNCLFRSNFYFSWYLYIFRLFSKLIFNFVFFLNVSYGYNAKRNWKQKTYLQCMNTRVVPNQSIQFILKILLFSPGHTTRGRWIIIDIYHF